MLNSTGLSSLNDTTNGLNAIGQPMGLYMDQAMDLSSVSIHDESKLHAKQQQQQIQQQNIQQQQQQRDQENLKELNERLKSVLSSGGAGHEMGVATPPVEANVQHHQVLNEAAHILSGQDTLRSTASTMSQQQLQQHIFQHARTSSPSNPISRRNSVDLKEKPAAVARLQQLQLQPQHQVNSSAATGGGQNTPVGIDCPDFVAESSQPINQQLISKFHQSLNTNMINNDANLAAMYNSFQNMMNTYNPTLSLNAPYANIANLLANQQQQPPLQNSQTINSQIAQQLSQSTLASQVQLNQLNLQQQTNQFENQLNMQTLTFLQDLFQK
jgi:hypothetical protein